jgi:hypothetical protein
MVDRFRAWARLPLPLLVLVLVACPPELNPGDDDTSGDDDDSSDEECRGDGVWYDSTSGLCWEERSFPDEFIREDASAYCAELTLGTHEDWRKPAFDELRSLVRDCSATATGGDCPVTETSGMDDWNSACGGCGGGQGPGGGGCYWDPELDGACDNKFWSSSPTADDERVIWLVDFHTAGVEFEDSYNNYVRCVR